MEERKRLGATVTMWEVLLSKKAQQDLEKIVAAGFLDHVKKLLLVIQENPFANPPEYEKLRGNLQGCYSRRINIRHRLVYRVLKETKTVEVLRMWSHYE